MPPSELGPKRRRIDGVHYTQHVEAVKALRRAGDNDAAAGLLLRQIEAVEREASIPLAGRTGVPPWYYTQLRIVYRKLGRHDLADRTMARWAEADARARASGQLAQDAFRDT